MKISQYIAILLVGSLPSLTQANNLTFINDTNVDFSLRIENACSSAIGTIFQHTIHSISEVILRKECSGDLTDCAVEIFNAPNCQGRLIETFILDLKYGIKSLEGGDSDSAGNKYYFSAEGFNLYVSNH